MHRELKEHLHSAVGESRFVVVVFLDVRGFSSFAKIAESSESAVFLKCIYTKILDDYFPTASFFKPTGDGLLIVLDFQDEDTLRTTVANAVETSIRLVEQFAGLCADDPMVNFSVPGDLGIGLARGAATCLRSGERTLDYSGRPLNLASRLMDIARPSGVVFGDDLGPQLLPDHLLERFTEERVYVKGLAEDIPMRAYVLSGHTRVPAFNRMPMKTLQHHHEAVEAVKFKDLREREMYGHPLTREPADREAITVTVTHPKATPGGRPRKTLLASHKYNAEYGERAGRPFAAIDYGPVVAFLESQGVRDSWTVNILVEYPVQDLGEGID